MYTRGNAVRAAPAMLLAALMVFPIFSNPLAGGDGARPPPTPDNLWFFVPPTEKVGPNATYPNTSAVYNGTTILLSAARGEHEAFQFVYCVSYNRTGNLSLTAFTSDSGTIPTSCFEFYQVWYPTEALTEWPDPLIPILPNQTLNFTTLRNNVFLIDVFVPEATLPGIYRGNFSFDWQIKPVELTVWDITLPGKNTLQTWFDDSPSSWASAYGYAPWSSEHQELMKNVYARYKEFRLSPGNIDLGMVGRYNMSVSDGVVSVDFSGTDPWLEYCLDGLGFTSFRFPLTGYSPRRADMDASTGHPDGPYFWGAPPYDMNPLYADHIGQYIKQVADHYRQKGWLDKAYVYVTDEPIAFNNAVNSYWQHPDYHVVSEFYDLVKANAPDLKFINTAQPVPELFNYTDVWAVPGGYYHELDAGERISQNQSVWWYNVDAGIASDGVKGRALYWDTFSRGLQGVLYWGTNYWDYDTVNGDPWQGSNSNGDGYLFYPRSVAWYGQDKLEFEGFIINAGVRVDYLSARAPYLKNQFEPDSGSVYPGAKWQISPRLGISHPVTERTVFHLSYGHFFQQPQFQYLFESLGANVVRRGHSIVGTPGVHPGQLPPYKSLYDSWKANPPDWFAKQTWVPLVRDGLDHAKAIPNHQFGLDQFVIGQPIWEKFLKGEETDPKKVMQEAKDAVVAEIKKTGCCGLS